MRRRDAETMIEVLQRATGEDLRMWGSIVGFGEYHYTYESGREGDAPAAGFATRPSTPRSPWLEFGRPSYEISALTSSA